MIKIALRELFTGCFPTNIMEFHHDDPDLIWINPAFEDEGRGSFEEPFCEVERALANIGPGRTIVLQAGEYGSDLNIQVSGNVRNPIRIAAESEGAAIVKSACWFFYDTSDLIVSGIKFTEAPNGAITLIGACSRNRFDNISFINCGVRKSAACTFYIGGAGGGCNVIENCSFEHDPGSRDTKLTARTASIGLMVSQGDTASGDPLVNNIIRRNRFSGYGFGILVGGDDSKNVHCGHVVEYNIVRNCSHEGIFIKSADTTVRGNVIEHCSGNALSLGSELDCNVVANRISDCINGIVVHGKGHTISGNCLIRCAGGGVRVGRADPAAGAAALNCFVESNTFIDCGTPSAEGGSRIAGVIIDSGTSGIMQHNLIWGEGRPYGVVQKPGLCNDEGESAVTQFVIKDNGAAGSCSLLDGVGYVETGFDDAAGDNYGNSCGFGAQGWVLLPGGFDPDIDEVHSGGDYRESSIVEDDEGNPIIPDGEPAGRGNLFGNFFAQYLDEGGDDMDGYMFPANGSEE